MSALSKKNLEKKMSFGSHVEELRLRLMRCGLLFLIGFCVFYFFCADFFLDFLRRPLFAVLAPEDQKLYFTHLFENFLTHIKVSAYASVILLFPLYIQQLWSFIAPGLLQRERRLVVPFIFLTSFFFLLGTAFAYFVLFPIGFRYFVEFGQDAEVPLLTMDSYYTTCLRLLLLFGIAFELPVILCLLGLLGLVDAAGLKRQRRHAVLLISVVSALFAPPDAISMILLAVPLVFLYEVAIWVLPHLRAEESVSRAATEVETEVEPPDPFRGASRL